MWSSGYSQIPPSLWPVLPAVAPSFSRIGFEFKRTAAPKLTKSMRIALGDLKLDRVDVIHPGEDTFLIAENV